MTSPTPRVLALFGAVPLLGQERANIEALASLQNAGCEVLCLIRNGTSSKAVSAALNARGLRFKKTFYIEQRLPGRVLVFLFVNPLALMLANFHFLWTFVRFRPSVIYAFNQLFVLNFLPSLVLIPTPIIYRAGDVPVGHNAFHRGVWSFIVARSRCFVANSQFVKSQLVMSGVPAERIQIIYNKPPARSPTGDFTLPPARADTAPLNIAYVGQITEAKGVDVLVEALRELRRQRTPARLLVAGPLPDYAGEAWTREFVRRSQADAELRDHVHFLGYVQDVRELFAAADIHVCPSVFEEPSANVVMEAKQAGKGSVVFRSGGLPELVEHGVDGLICAEKTAPCLAAALARYCDNPALVRDHGRAAHASLARFEGDLFTQKWRNAIDATTRSACHRRSLAP